MRDAVHTVAPFQGYVEPMKYLTSCAAILLALCTTSCASTNSSDRPGVVGGDTRGGKQYEYALRVPPMDPNRRIIELNCRDSYVTDGGNLRCM